MLTLVAMNDHTKELLEKGLRIYLNLVPWEQVSFTLYGLFWLSYRSITQTIHP